MSTRSDDNRRDAVRGARRALSGPVEVDIDLLAAVQDGLLKATTNGTSPWHSAGAPHQEHSGLAARRHP